MLIRKRVLQQPVPGSPLGAGGGWEDRQAQPPLPVNMGFNEAVDKRAHPRPRD